VGKFSPEPVFLFEHVLLDVMASAKRVSGAAAEPALFALGRLPLQVSVPHVGATAGPIGTDLAGYESFRRRI
jgi:hypothetical protein